LFDELLPAEVRELPEELAALDRRLADPRLLAPIEQAWERTARERGRPTIPMASFVRLIASKQRTGWGYQTLDREVSDSLHLHRFCLIPIAQRVPDESTVRKLAGRLRGPTVRVVDRSRRIGKLVRAISKTLSRRTGQCTGEVLALNVKAGQAMARSIREARALAAHARTAARGRGARAKLHAARQLDDLADRCQRIVTQIQQRQRGEPISDRLV
jgi:hypothetical protein